jgi:hypothetical protein
MVLLELPKLDEGSFLKDYCFNNDADTSVQVQTRVKSSSMVLFCRHRKVGFQYKSVKETEFTDHYYGTFSN